MLFYKQLKTTGTLYPIAIENKSAFLVSNISLNGKFLVSLGAACLLM